MVFRLIMEEVSSFLKNFLIFLNQFILLVKNLFYIRVY